MVKLLVFVVTLFIFAHIFKNYTRSFLDGAIGNIDNLTMETTHNALSVGQLLVDAVHIRIDGSIAQAHGLQPLSTDFVELEGVNQKADNLIRRTLEELFGRSQLRYQGYIGDLYTLVS